jgi:hypothetical protein
MPLRPSVHAGSLSGALSLIGTGLAMAPPSQNWIGWVFVAAGVVILFLDIRIERGHFEVGAAPGREKIIPLPVSLLAVSG